MSAKRLFIESGNPQQLEKEFWARDLPGFVRIANIEPNCLELELTESQMIANTTSGPNLRELHSIGIRIAVDDFGTGYSALRYLKTFPISTLKIDKSFVTGLPEDPDNAAIVRAVISLGDVMGLNVIAEGVETRQQLRFLRAHGCKKLRGFSSENRSRQNSFARTSVVPRFSI